MPQKPPPRDRFLTREEVDALAAAAPHHVRMFVMLALHTAGRATAILELTWGRVDMNAGLIDLNPVERIRTKKGRSVVPINDVLRPVLEEARKGALSKYVVEWAGDRVLSIKKGFAAAAARAGIERCSPHDLRRTAARRMAENGVPMSEISQFLGHTDSRVTERVYSRYSPSYLRKAAAALE